MTLRFFMTYHPETDGQTKSANKSMEQYLHFFISYQQDNWPDWLLSTEFSANNYGFSTINIFPFFAKYGFPPRIGIKLLIEASLQLTSQRARLQIEDTNKFSEKMMQLYEFLHEEMTYAQALQEKYPNRKKTPGAAYQVGD